MYRHLNESEREALVEDSIITLIQTLTLSLPITISVTLAVTLALNLALVLALILNLTLSLSPTIAPTLTLTLILPKCEALMEDFLVINYLLMDVHAKIEHMADVDLKEYNT